MSAVRDFGAAVAAFGDDVEKLAKEAEALRTPRDSRRVRGNVEKMLGQLGSQVAEIDSSMKDAKRTAPETDEVAEFKRFAAEWKKAKQTFEKQKKAVKEALEEPLRKRQIAGSAADDEENDDVEAQESNILQHLKAERVTRYDTSALATKEDIEREKAEEIVRISEDVAEVKGMYIDMSTLVTHQGTHIDTVQHNVEETRVAMQDGTSNLQQAGEYQKSSRKKMCCLIVMLLLIIGVIVIVVAVSS